MRAKEIIELIRSNDEGKTVTVLFGKTEVDHKKDFEVTWMVIDELDEGFCRIVLGGDEND